MKKYLLSIALLTSSLFAVAQGTITWGFGSGIIDSCSFQTGNCSLISFDTSAQNIWQQGTSNKTFFGSTNGVFTDSINIYPKNNYSYFEIKVPHHDVGTVLSFTHKFDTDTLIDGGYVEYYNDLDTMWENVLSHSIHNVPHGFSFYNMHNDTLNNGEHGFSGKTNNWITTQM